MIFEKINQTEEGKQQNKNHIVADRAYCCKK